MATTKPRIGVTLEPHRYEMLKRLASLQGVSMSALVSELIETVADPLERVVVVLEAAQRAPESVIAGLRAATSKAEANFLPAAAASLQQLDIFLSDVSSAAREADAVGAAEPPSSNTGVNRPKRARGLGSDLSGSAVPVSRNGKASARVSHAKRVKR